MTAIATTPRILFNTMYNVRTTHETKTNGNNNDTIATTTMMMKGLLYTLMVAHRESASGRIMIPDVPRLAPAIEAKVGAETQRQR